MLQIYNSGGRVQILHRPFASIAQEDLKFEERPCTFTKQTLELKRGMQSGPRSTLPPVADDLQARKRRDRSPVRHSVSPCQRAIRRRQPRRSRGRTTWLLRDAELRRQIEKASDVEVEERPPFWPKIAATSLVTACGARSCSRNLLTEAEEE